MSDDQYRPDGWAAPGAWPSPTPGAPPAPLEPPAAAAYVSTGKPKRRGRVVAGALGLAVVLVGAGITWKVSTNRSSSGASSPDAATRDLLSAMQNGDVLGMIDALPASERNMVRDAVQQWVDEGTRLGLLKANINLKKVPGYSLQITNLGLTTESVNDHIAVTHINRGTYSFNAAMKSLPLGDVVTSHLPADVKDPTAEGNLADHPIDVAVVKEGSAWHVSLLYSAAEQIRHQAKAAAPTAADRVPAKGADTPEAAVHAMVEAALGTDLRRAIELMPPDEMAVMHDYAGLMIKEVDKAKTNVENRVAPAAKDIAIDELALQPVEVTGGVKLLPTKVAIHATVDGEKVSVLVEKVGQDCVHYTVSATKDSAAKDDKKCASDIASLDLPIPQSLTQKVVKLVSKLAEVGIVTTKVDGKWFVSPIRTSSDLLFTLSNVIERKDIVALLDDRSHNT